MRWMTFWMNGTLLKHEIEASTKPKQKIGRSFIPSPCSVGVRRDTGKKVEDVKIKPAQILKEKDDFKFKHNSQPAIDVIRVQSTSSIDLKKVHGWDIQRKKIEIMSKLMLDCLLLQLFWEDFCSSRIWKGGDMSKEMKYGNWITRKSSFFHILLI